MSNTQIKFLSCHVKRKLWLSRLQELISPFDSITWCLLIASLLGLSLLLGVQLQKSNIQVSAADAFYDLFAILLEKGGRMFDWTLAKAKNLQHFTAFAIPFMLLVLSNEYRGDNITRLTVEPDLQPFDEFDDLVEEKFPIYAAPVHLSKFILDNIPPHVKLLSNSTKTSNHEWFPVVSNLWYSIMLRWNMWSTLKEYAHLLSNRTWFYLNNTQIYDHGVEVIGSVGYFHNTSFMAMDYTWLYTANSELRKCNRSVVLLRHDEALQVNTELSFFKFSVLFGNDIINENMFGYKLFGQMPSSIFLRTKHLFESGICDFWNKYLDYLLVIRVNSGDGHYLSEYFVTNRDSSIAIYVLLIIFGSELFLSFLALLYENRSGGRHKWKTMYITLQAFIKRYIIRIKSQKCFKKPRSFKTKVTIILVNKKQKTETEIPSNCIYIF